MNFAGEVGPGRRPCPTSPVEAWGRRYHPHAPTQSSNDVWTPALCMFALCASACQHASLNRAEAGAQTVVEHLIADPHNQAADQRWVDTIAQLQPLAITRA